MNITNLALLTSVTAMSIINASAQTTDEIINKWTDAMGGRDKLANIKTVYSEDETNFMNNISPSKTYTINGKKLKNESTVNGFTMISNYSYDSCWFINPAEGITSVTNMPAMQAKVGQLFLDASGPLHDYAAKGSKVEFTGKASLNNVTSYTLKLITATGIEMNLFIDSTTGYVLKDVSKITADGETIEVTLVNSNYKKTADGFVMPFTQEMIFPDASITITHKKIEVNKEIDPAIFEKPKR